MNSLRQQAEISRNLKSNLLKFHLLAFELKTFISLFLVSSYMNELSAATS
jgi:hypothetical protein